MFVITSSYLILSQFLYLFYRIEFTPFSEKIAVLMLFLFSVLYMSYGVYQFVQGFGAKEKKSPEKKKMPGLNHS